MSDKPTAAGVAPPAILAVDGHSLLYRAYFALPDTIRDPSGRPVNGIYGFVTMLARLLREHHPSSLLIAFDSPWPTLRHAKFSEYKAKRAALPQALLVQVPLLQGLLRRIGIAVLAVAGYEADDILASLSERCLKYKTPLILVSGDRDLFQLVHDPWIRLLYTKRGVNKSQMLDELGVEQMVGVPPSRYGEFAALRGDPADNITGAPGIGEKSALNIVRSAPSLDVLYAHPEGLPRDLGNRLLAARGKIEENRQLMRPMTALSIDWESIPLSIRIDRKESKAAFGELGLMRAFETLLSAWPSSAPHQPLSVSHTDRDSVLSHPKRFCLVSCSADKIATRAKAKDLYASALFKKSREWAELAGGNWYILSAKHALVAPETPISPYDKSLKEATKQERERWGRAVTFKLRTVVRPKDIVFLLAGGTYSDAIRGGLIESGCRLVQPLQGMSIGRRLRWLNTACTVGKPSADLEEFYEILSRLASGTGGPRSLAEADQCSWPERGVYFFFESGEHRLCSHTLRVVRVGTHAVSANSQSTLWNRLRTHRGVAGGGGNHRSSIFRSHIGAAIINRDTRRSDFPEWGDQEAGTAKVRSLETGLEQTVSSILSGMQILCLNIPDEPGPRSDRAYIERNAIALLSKVGSQMDTPSPDWLGRSSPHPSIRKSGLWNVNFVDEPYCDPAFLDVLDYYARATVGTVPFTGRSVAPPDWWERARSRDQLHFQWSEKI